MLVVTNRYLSDGTIKEFHQKIPFHLAKNCADGIYRLDALQHKKDEEEEEDEEEDYSIE